MSERQFPIMGGPSIPWSLIAPHELQAIANHDQTLTRLAERGGLSCCEAVAVLEDRKWKKMPDGESRARLIELRDKSLESQLTDLREKVRGLTELNAETSKAAAENRSGTEALMTRCDLLTDLIRRLRLYARHGECSSINNEPHPCDCAFDRLEADLNAAFPNGIEQRDGTDGDYPYPTSNPIAERALEWFKKYGCCKVYYAESMDLHSDAMNEMDSILSEIEPSKGREEK